MATSWDLFFSYRRHDLERARPLLNALAQAGVRVWHDEKDIPDQGSITSEIRHGIANSKALLAFYSSTYPMSNPCQQEITTAWLAAQQMDQTATRRVWLVNPEASFEHVPELLREQRIPLVTGDCSRFATIAEGLKRRLDQLDATPLGSGFGDPPAYYGMSPVQARLFVGRTTELWDLHGKLTANRISIVTGVYGQATTQVRGLGGNGKSLLAREYSIRFGPAYPGGVFWLNAYGHDHKKGSVSPEQREALRQDQIREFATQYGVQTKDLKANEIETSLWRAIERRGERCLWIVDDVPSGLNPDELDRVWYGRWAGASTLLTTRSKEYGAVGSALDLGVLSSREAFDLVCSHRQPASSAEESAAHRIVELLGCHPLAVEVAGSYLAQGFDGFESYLDALANLPEDALELGNLLKESLPTGHERSISATLLRSIRQLSLEGLDFLRLASVLGVAPIQVSFVSEVFGFLEHDGKVRSLKAVNEVGALSLCEHFGDDARTVHTLISRTMRFQFPGEERTGTLRSAAVQALTERLQRAGHIGEHLKIALDIPHARHLVTSDLQTEQETKLAFWVARRDYERADYSAARELQEQVLAALRRVLGEEHPDTLLVMNDLGQTLYAQDDLSGARKLEEHVLAALRRALGEEHPDTLKAMGNLAQMLKAQGDLASAGKLQEQVLAALRRVLGEKHPDTLVATDNLAETLKAQDDLSGAGKLQEQVLAALRRVLGEEHPDTLLAMNNLGQTLYAQGDLAGARKLEEEVLAVSRRVLGEEHPQTLTTMSNLAQTLHAQGDLVGARKLQEPLLAARRRVLGEEHPKTLLATAHLAQTLYAQGYLEDARKLQEQVLAALRRVLGEEHPDTLKEMSNLAVMLYAQGDLASARKLEEEVLAVSRRVLGEEHPNTLRATDHLAQTLKAQDDWSGARKLQEQVLEASRRVLGEEHPDTLLAMKNLGQTLYAQGDLAGARKLEEEVLTVSRRVLGDEQLGAS
jgi:DnaJ-domain-containing protein 1